MISIDGLDIKEYAQQSIRQLIGFVPQDTVLFNDTILYNIKYGRINASMKEVEDAASAAQLLPFINSLPEKWETKVGERGLKLSGGEKQRIAIARCLLKNPPIIVLDESTSSLDSLTEASILEAIRLLSAGGRTMIIIAHRLSTIKSADNIIVMDNGSILQSGMHDDLISVEGKYKLLYDMQHQHSS